MRALQQVIRVIGTLVLGSVWGITAVGVMASAIFTGGFNVTRIEPFLFFPLCGLPLGAIAGLWIGVRIARDESEDWSRIVWIGVALGAALGIVFDFQSPLRAGPGWVGVRIPAIWTAILGALGGMFAETGEGIWRRNRKGRSDAVATKIRLLFAVAIPSLLLVLIALLFQGHLNLNQSAWLILVGIPILYGLPIWLKLRGADTVVRDRKGPDEGQGFGRNEGHRRARTR